MKNTSLLTIPCLSLCFSFLMACTSVTPAEKHSSLWKIDSLATIGGATVAVSGDPQVITTAYGKAVRFDGDGDRVIMVDGKGEIVDGDQIVDTIVETDHIQTLPITRVA